MNKSLFTRVVVPMLLVLPPAASAVEPGVKDNAGFFKPETVQEANRQIQRIKSDLGKDLIVETFAEVPAELRDEQRQMSADQFFRTWAGERAKRIGVQGVYVLITRNPRRLETAWRKQDQTNITPAEGNQFTQLLIKGFRQDRYDATLLEAIRFFETHAAGHAAESPRDSGTSGSAGTTATPSSPPSPGPYSSPVPPAQGNRPFGTTSRGLPIGGLVCVGVAILLIFLMIRGVARGFGGGGRTAGPSAGGPMGGGTFGGYGGGYGGGGFGKGILGGMLGGMFGGYVADRYRDSRRSADDTGGGFLGGSGGTSSDFGTAGGDFGGSSSSDSSDSSSQSSPPSSDFGNAGSDFGGGGDSGGGGDYGGSGGSF